MLLSHRSPLASMPRPFASPGAFEHPATKLCPTPRQVFIERRQIRRNFPNRPSRRAVFVTALQLPAIRYEEQTAIEKLATVVAGDSCFHDHQAISARGWTVASLAKLWETGNAPGIRPRWKRPYRCRQREFGQFRKRSANWRDFQSISMLGSRKTIATLCPTRDVAQLG